VLHFIKQVKHFFLGICSCPPSPGRGLLFFLLVANGELVIFHGPRKLADYDQQGKLKELKKAA
jgi:hypothetical protein